MGTTVGACLLVGLVTLGQGGVAMDDGRITLRSATTEVALSTGASPSVVSLRDLATGREFAAGADDDELFWLAFSPAGNPAAGLSLVGVIAITFLYQFFLYNATGEEAGWSGFARPRLQAHVSPLLASLVMTVFWALWHAFYWYGQEPVFSPRYWIDTYVRLVPAVVLIGWFYNRSKGSIFLAGVVHAVANTAFAYMPNIDWPVHTVTMYVAAAALVFLDRMWAKLPADHPAVVSGSSALDEMRKHSGEGEEVELADATEPGTARI